ncbi:MAG: hypothetical protein PHP79_08320 [Clostridia bacterium]|nr:hypothetical protein [Clostridia bacterium]
MSIDYASIFGGLVTTTLSAISDTLPVVVPILGVMAAIGVGVKLFKKFTGKA